MDPEPIRGLFGGRLVTRTYPNTGYSPFEKIVGLTDAGRHLTDFLAAMMKFHMSPDDIRLECDISLTPAAIDVLMSLRSSEHYPESN